MKILVTGANGYLGQGIVEKLIDHGHAVVATDLDVTNTDDRAIKRSCDIFEVENPYAFFDKPDALLHLAWRDGFAHYSDAHISDLPKHYNFLKKMTGSNIKSVAVMGTMYEVGLYEGCIYDNTPCDPYVPYGISKNALRLLTQTLCANEFKNYLWLRGYYIVGNSPFGSSIFAKIAAAELEGTESFPFTTGQNQYDFLDYEEFCEKTARAVTQDTVSGIINICSGYPQKLADRVERFIKENDYGIKLEYGAFPERPYDSKAVWGDSTKIDAIMKSTSESG